MAGVAEKSGPPGNGNALKHGVHRYLTLGRLPKGASYIGRVMFQFRRAVESAVQDRAGGIGLYESCLIQSGCRHESRAQLLQRYLRTEAELSLADRVQLLREIGAASDSRDRCLEKLKLNEGPEPLDIGSILASVHAEQQAVQNRAARDGVEQDEQSMVRGCNDAAGGESFADNARAKDTDFEAEGGCQ